MYISQILSKIGENWNWYEIFVQKLINISLKMQVNDGVIKSERKHCKFGKIGDMRQN